MLVVHLGLHLEGVSACEEGAGPQASVPQQATIPLPLPHTASFFKDSQSHLRKSVVEIINIQIVVLKMPFEFHFNEFGFGRGLRNHVYYPNLYI